MAVVVHKWQQLVGGGTLKVSIAAVTAAVVHDMQRPDNARIQPLSVHLASLIIDRRSIFLSLAV